MLIFKIIGCMLVIASSAGMGFYFSGEIKSRIEDLKELKKLIGLLRGDIRYASTPLPEAISAMARRSSGHFEVFLKNVSGKLSTDYVINDKPESTEKDNISIDRLQWSINTSVGVEYNLFSKIGLYAEPGVIYYFKNGSEVETIYKEKPVNVNLRVGLRFSLGE